jgi:hypothetical protein
LAHVENLPLITDHMNMENEYSINLIPNPTNLDEFISDFLAMLSDNGERIPARGILAAQIAESYLDQNWAAPLDATDEDFDLVVKAFTPTVKSSL